MFSDHQWSVSVWRVAQINTCMEMQHESTVLGSRLYMFLSAQLQSEHGFLIHNGHGAIKEKIIAKLGAHTSYIHLS